MDFYEGVLGSGASPILAGAPGGFNGQQRLGGNPCGHGIRCLEEGGG